MKIDTNIVVSSLRDVPALAQAAEAIGFDGIWASETNHDPFLMSALMAEHTRRVSLGTAIAVAFPRSPGTLAYLAWDLAALSNGRFILGLGSQVKAHNERRFGVKWEAPVARLREVILAVRALWDTWQNGTELNFRGQFFKLTLMSPFFNPGPIAHPDIPIYIAGVNQGMCRLAGELCDGFHVHPFHSVRYLREVILPTIEEGLRVHGRQRHDIKLVSSVFVIPSDTETERKAASRRVRQQIAFYASTPSYAPVMELHGWGDIREQLSRLAARRRWSEMPALISDEMLELFALSGRWDELPGLIMSRYEGLLDRVMYYLPFLPGEMDGQWRQAISAFKDATMAAS
ncbi:MAG: LLM class F420-dependent oxidoreductase [Anaerolineae bacterium]